MKPMSSATAPMTKQAIGAGRSTTRPVERIGANAPTRSRWQSKIRRDRRLTASLVSAHEFDERRRKRHDKRADEPEQRHHHAGAPQPRVGPQVFHESERGAQRVAVDLSAGAASAVAGIALAHEPAGHGKHHHQARRTKRSGPPLSGDAACDCAEQDRDEGGAFDERVAGRDFIEG